MCGRFVQFSDPDTYKEVFELDACPDVPARYNIAPTQQVLAVRAVRPGSREAMLLRWGLVPSWSKGPDSRYSMINARAESVHERPAYRSAFRSRRCLIPAEGFYEWQNSKTGKQPFLISITDHTPFAMAGLWETWQGPDGSPLQTCTVIVTEANSAIRPVHDRMPVILPPDSYDRWLDPDIQDPSLLMPLLLPYPADGTHLTPVSQRVNNARNDDPDLIKALSAA